jgi:hypothetical protein
MRWAQMLLAVAQYYTCHEWQRPLDICQSAFETFSGVNSDYTERDFEPWVLGDMEVGK